MLRPYILLFLILDFQGYCRLPTHENFFIKSDPKHSLVSPEKEKASIQSVHKYALIIAISNYEKTHTGWPSINAANDVPLIKNALLHQAFPESNISLLQDEAATRTGIVAAIKNLENKAEQGDIILIHYSGHGQQIYDDNGDEPDGLDEALVAWGAPANCDHNPTYKGDKHVRDDELGILVEQLREKVGSEGHVILSLDACHSSTGSRGGFAIARGGMPPLIPAYYTIPATGAYQQEKGFGMNEIPASSKGNELALGKFILFAGASFDERNYETKDDNGVPVGSLSYAISKVLSNAGTRDTYRSIFANILAIMAEKCPRQSPVMEGDVDNLLFGGEVVPQTPYFTITRINSPQEIQINGGIITGATPGSQVAFFKEGTSNPAVIENRMATGKVIYADNFSATIQLDTPLPELDNNPILAWVFVTHPALIQQKLKVNIEDILDVQAKAYFKMQLSSSERIVIDTTTEADVRIEAVKAPINAFVMQTSDYVIGCSDPDDCSQKLEKYAKSIYIKSLKPFDARYHLIMQLIPVEVDSHQRITRILDMEYFLNAGNVPNLPENTYYQIRIRHTGTERAYYNIIDIQPDGPINPLIPYYTSTGQYTNPNEFFLEPGTERSLPQAVLLQPPYGLEIFRILTNSQPVHLENLFFDDQRGDLRNTTHEVSGSSFDYAFKIVPPPQ